MGGGGRRATSPARPTRVRVGIRVVPAVACVRLPGGVVRTRPTVQKQPPLKLGNRGLRHLPLAIISQREASAVLSTVSSPTVPHRATRLTSPVPRNTHRRPAQAGVERRDSVSDSVFVQCGGVLGETIARQHGSGVVSPFSTQPTVSSIPPQLLCFHRVTCDGLGVALVDRRG